MRVNAAAASRILLHTLKQNGDLSSNEKKKSLWESPDNPPTVLPKIAKKKKKIVVKKKGAVKKKVPKNVTDVEGNLGNQKNSKIQEKQESEKRSRGNETSNIPKTKKTTQKTNVAKKAGKKKKDEFVVRKKVKRVSEDDTAQNEASSYSQLDDSNLASIVIRVRNSQDGGDSKGKSNDSRAIPYPAKEYDDLRYQDGEDKPDEDHENHETEYNENDYDEADYNEKDHDETEDNENEFDSDQSKPQDEGGNSSSVETQSNQFGLKKRNAYDDDNGENKEEREIPLKKNINYGSSSGGVDIVLPKERHFEKPRLNKISRVLAGTYSVSLILELLKGRMKFRFTGILIHNPFRNVKPSNRKVSPHEWAAKENIGRSITNLINQRIQRRETLDKFRRILCENYPPHTRSFLTNCATGSGNRMFVHYLLLSTEMSGLSRVQKKYLRDIIKNSL